MPSLKAAATASSLPLSAAMQQWKQTPGHPDLPFYQKYGNCNLNTKFLNF
jgi:hypothetical protein